MLLQRRCRYLLNTAHLSVTLMSQWCSRWRSHIEYLFMMSLLIAGVQAPLEAWRHDEQLQQRAMLPWQQWLVVISNRWRHATCLQQRRVNHCSERTAWVSIYHTVQNNAATTTSCATVTGRDEPSKWHGKNTSPAGHRALTITNKP